MYYDIDDDTTSDSKTKFRFKGHSSFWTSRFNYTSWRFSREDSNTKLRKALETIARIVYLVGIRDRQFTLHFLDKTVNQPVEYLGNKIFFDSDIILGKKKSLEDITEAEKIDILCGDALIKSQLRLSIPYGYEVWDRSAIYMRGSDTDATKNMYLSAECFSCSSRIRENFPGYVPYLQSHQTYKFDRQLHEDLINTPNSRTSARYTITASLFYPDLNLDLGLYEKDQDLALLLKTATSTPNRIEVTQAVEKELRKRYPEPEDEDQQKKIDQQFSSMLEPGSVEYCPVTPYPHEDPRAVGHITAEITRTGCSVHGVRQVSCSIRTETEKSPISYSRVVNRVKPITEEIKSKLELPKTQEALDEYGFRSGLLDEGALDKLAYNSDHVFSRQEILNKSKLSVSVLLDESGSMNGIIGTAISTVVALYEALSSFEEIEVGIYGHSGHIDCDVIRYKTPHEGDITSLVTSYAKEQNYDSFAIKTVVADILSWARPDNTHNLLFVVSDGEPAGHNYYGEPTLEHCKSVVDQAQIEGIKVYGIGIDGRLSSLIGNQMYGPGRFISIKDVKSSGPIIGSFVARLLQS